MDDFTHGSLMNTLMNDEPIGEIMNPPGYAKKTVVSGTCEGLLVGGNLSLIVGLLGTPYELDTRGRILFIEDVGEKTYSLDRMLTHLRLAGKFDDCAGVVLGDFKNCEMEYPGYSFTLEEIVWDVVAPCGKPVFSGLQSGHCIPKITLPMGVRCRMDAEKCALIQLEAAVC